MAYQFIQNEIREYNIRVAKQKNSNKRTEILKIHSIETQFIIQHVHNSRHSQVTDFSPSHKNRYFITLRTASIRILNLK